MPSFLSGSRTGQVVFEAEEEQDGGARTEAEERDGFGALSVGRPWPCGNQRGDENQNAAQSVVHFGV